MRGSRVSHATLYAMFAKGLLTPRKVLAKTVVTEADLQAFIAGLPPATTVRVKAAQQAAE